MIPVPFRVRRASVAAALAGLLAVTGGLSACAGAAFEPSGPCTVDGQRPGAYPDLEATIPDSLDGRGPDVLDSGRSCSPTNLGTLARHGVTELRFAGGTWQHDARSGVTLAVFTAPGLRVDWMAEFYEAGARAGRNIDDVTTERRTAGAVDYIVVEALNDESFQTIGVLDDDVAGTVRVILVGSDVREIGTRDAHDERVAAAVAAWVTEG